MAHRSEVRRSEKPEIGGAGPAAEGLIVIVPSASLV